MAREHGLTPVGVTAQIERLLPRPRSVFDALDADALATIGIDLHAVRDAVQASFGPGPMSSPRAWHRRRPRLPGHLPVTGRAQSCLRTAGQEAQRSGATQVGVHHIGAAVVASGGGLVPPILSALGVSAPTLRTAILDRAQ